MISFDTFTTPAGNKVQARYRPDTSDWNSVSACVKDDEYGLAEHPWTGTAIDVGAHIGGATLALLADNPDLRVISIEPLPANLELLRENVAQFGDRCIVIDGAGDCGTTPVTIAYGATSDDPFVQEHRFIGGGIWQGGPSGEQVEVAPISLSSLVEKYGPISLVKIDCEGCEWSFLFDPAVRSVGEFRGEYHPRGENGPAQIVELLDPTHIVEIDETLNFGPFRAVRR